MNLYLLVAIKLTTMILNCLKMILITLYVLTVERNVGAEKMKMVKNGGGVMIVNKHSMMMVMKFIQILKKNKTQQSDWRK